MLTDDPQKLHLALAEAQELIKTIEQDPWLNFELSVEINERPIAVQQALYNIIHAVERSVRAVHLFRMKYDGVLLEVGSVIPPMSVPVMDVKEIGDMFREIKQKHPEAHSYALRDSGLSQKWVFQKEAIRAWTQAANNAIAKKRIELQARLAA